MSDANKALAEVRGWLCDNLSSGDAGKVCGMLSVVSRHINELEEENVKLRELVQDMWFWRYEGHMDNKSQEWQMKHIDGVLCRMRELGVPYAKE